MAGKVRVAFAGAATVAKNIRVAFTGAAPTPTGGIRVAFTGAAAITTLTALTAADQWVEPFRQATLDGSQSVGTLAWVSWGLIYNSYPDLEPVPTGALDVSGLTVGYIPIPHWQPITLTWQLTIGDSAGATSSAVVQHTVAPYHHWRRTSGDTWVPIDHYSMEA